MSSEFFTGPKRAALSLREIIGLPFVVLGFSILAVGLLINGGMTWRELKFWS